MSIKQDIKLDVGASWGVDFQCDVPLTGAEITFWLGTRDAKTLTASVGNGITINENDDTQCALDLSPPAQAAAGVQNQDAKLYYELWVKESDGAESRQAHGRAYLSAGLAKKYP